MKMNKYLIAALGSVILAAVVRSWELNLVAAAVILTTAAICVLFVFLEDKELLDLKAAHTAELAKAKAAHAAETQANIAAWERLTGIRAADGPDLTAKVNEMATHALGISQMLINLNASLRPALLGRSFFDHRVIPLMVDALFAHYNEHRLTSTQVAWLETEVSRINDTCNRVQGDFNRLFTEYDRFVKQSYTMIGNVRRLKDEGKPEAAASELATFERGLKAATDLANAMRPQGGGNGNNKPPRNGGGNGQNGNGGNNGQNTAQPQSNGP